MTSNVTAVDLTKERVCAQLPFVTDRASAWILLQEPRFIGFGVVQQDSIHWPPGVEPDWPHILDLRLFGEKGEWHAWQHWNNTWQSRLLTLSSIEDSITEYHALWGTRADTVTSPWVILTEDRGAAIWLPIEAGLRELPNLPLRLKIKQIVSCDPDNGLAGVEDAVLVALVSAFNDTEVLLAPVDL